MDMTEKIYKTTPNNVYTKNMKFRILAHTDQKSIDAMYNDYSPVFVLTTGRSGSKFLASLLNLSPDIRAYHEPKPALQYFSNFAYQHQDDKRLLTTMIDAARMELVLEAYIHGKIFVESNQCSTFFAPVIKDLFRRSKFVHLVRHPGDFVRSAARKGFHQNDSIWEAGRVRMKDTDTWDRLGQLERLSWLWKTSHQFIEDFKTQIKADRIMTCRIEDILHETTVVQTLLDFIGADTIPAETIQEVQQIKINELRIGPDEPPNMKKVAHFPTYPVWDQQMKELLRHYSGQLAEIYGYDLGGECDRTVQQRRPGQGHTPLLSIIIPNYNNAEYLRECLDSVLAQTYENIEILVCDDCSTDASRAIIQQYEQDYPHKLRALYLKANRGVASARNHALQHARGEYVSTLDSDDYYQDHRKLEKEMDLIAYHKREFDKEIIAFSDIVLVNDDKSISCYQALAQGIEEGPVFEKLLTRSCMVPRDFIALRSAYLACGGYNPAFTTHEDWDLKIQLALRHEFYFTGIAGTAYRRHGKGLSSGPFRKKTKNLWRVFHANIEFGTDCDQKRRLEDAFSHFMVQRDKEYHEYLKYQVCQISAERGKWQGRAFYIKALLYDFGVYGAILILSLLVQKLWRKIRYALTQVRHRLELRSLLVEKKIKLIVFAQKIL